ncbi:hypothetical protein G6F58_013114 [Rhizopus delemar]|nr:hypothetical protein G6F58_013114 [Rhizopus delemar]
MRSSSSAPSKLASGCAAPAASAPTTAAVFRAGRSPLSWATTRPLRYSCSAPFSAVSATCAHCPSGIGCAGVLRWPLSCTNGTRFSMPSTSSAAPSRRA